jgi:hypothetical protein
MGKKHFDSSVDEGLEIMSIPRCSSEPATLRRWNPCASPSTDARVSVSALEVAGDGGLVDWALSSFLPFPVPLLHVDPARENEYV